MIDRRNDDSNIVRKISIGEIIAIVSILIGFIANGFFASYHYGRLTEKVDSLSGWVQNLENRLDKK